MNINMGVTFDDTRARIFCIKCGGRGWEQHHITYSPEEKALMCDRCHKEITRLNKMASRRVPRGHPYRPLNNTQRKRIWRRYLHGSPN